MRVRMLLVLGGLVGVLAGRAEAATVLATPPFVAASGVDCMIANLHPKKTISVTVQLIDSGTGAVASGHSCTSLAPNRSCSWGASTSVGFCKFTVDGVSKKHVRAHGVTIADKYAVPAY